jgi:uncharacterized protein YecT (DUF1311 family)
MKKNTLVVLIILNSNCLFAEYIDCSRAKTYHQNFICSHSNLKQLDKDMNHHLKQAYQFKMLKKFLDNNQQNWNLEYKYCVGTKKNKNKDSLKDCEHLLVSRIQFFKDLHTAKIYTSSKGTIFSPTESTFMIIDRNGTKYLRYFGGWMSNGFMNPDDMKGYPFDGYVCESEVPLKSKDGKIYKANFTNYNENYDSFRDKFYIKYNNKELIMHGYIACGIRASTGGSGHYQRVYLK